MNYTIFLLKNIVYFCIMICINVTTGIQTSAEFDNPIFEIYLDNVPLGTGGFGQVYKVVQVNQEQVSNWACKIFYPSALSYQNFKNIQVLQKEYWKKQEIAQLPCLASLPFFSFEGLMSNTAVYGYLMRYIPEDTFANLSLFIEDKQAVQAYYNIDFSQKLGYVKTFVEGISTLHEIGFVHADISADNLFIHLQKPETILIDFDSGAIVQNKTKPTTWGKPNDWVEPQIMFDLAKQRNKKLPTVCVNTYSDVWSVHIGIHYLLFMVHPFFFIHTLSEKNLRLYFEHYRWPEAYQGKCDTIFVSDAQETYHKYLKILYEIVPDSVLSCFKQTFNEGFFNPEKRTELCTWAKVLSQENAPQNSFTLPAPVITKKTDYPALKAPKLRPTYKKKKTFQPQRKSFYPKYHQKSPFLQLSHLSSLKNLPYTGNNITTAQVIKLILLNLGIIILVFGAIQLWESMNKNKWIEKFKNIQPISYDTTHLQNKNSALIKEYQEYSKYEKSADSLKNYIVQMKDLPIQEVERIYQKSTQTLTSIQNRDDSLFKVMLRYKGQPDSLYISYQKWLRSYNTLVQYQKNVESLKKIVKK